MYKTNGTFCHITCRQNKWFKMSNTNCAIQIVQYILDDKKLVM